MPSSQEPMPKYVVRHSLRSPILSSREVSFAPVPRTPETRSAPPISHPPRRPALPPTTTPITRATSKVSSFSTQTMYALRPVHYVAKAFSLMRLWHKYLEHLLHRGCCIIHISIPHPNTDEDRELNNILRGIKASVDTSEASRQLAACDTLQPTTNAISGGNDSSFTRNKRSKGRVELSGNDSALHQFVVIAARGNDILEQWLLVQGHQQQQYSSRKTPTSYDSDWLEDAYSKCVRILQGLLKVGEQSRFLKGCKELQNEFVQKVFLLMTDKQRRCWFDEII
ncbi:hypothetical protein CJ030_MR3G009840 [Morella rubra]|uniref:Uncharacterized protein n=1 Tax=Morella rubra TaxID=262757 RepID=A0A6A1WC34_9ROSI|nr:hypothetical protein CJ030_MR3G009840 [Morella rubra]